MHTAKLKKLLRNINDEDASKRRSAAEALAEGDERAIYPLIKALRDDNLGVQDAAMHSLMEIKGETTAYMILPLLRENPFLRNTALIILREMGKIAVPLLYILLNDKDDDVRKFALDIINDVGHCNYPEKLVAMLTGDPNANVRATAAKALGTLKYRKAIPQLIKALEDDEWVCFSAIEALTGLQDERSINSMVTLLKSPSETIRFAAVEALGKTTSPEAAQHLTGHLSESDGFEKLAAIKSLARIGSLPPLPGIEDALIDMLKDDDWEDKLIAIKGLGAIKSGNAIYHMIDAAGSLDLSDPENEDKLYVFKEAIKGIGCNKVLIDLLNDSSIKYRGKAAAIEIVGELKCREAVPALVKLLKSEYRDVRRSSVKSLGGIDDGQAGESLMNAIHDHDSHVRKAAVAALGRIGKPAAFEPLMKLLHDEKYNDVIDEFINSLLSINSRVFISRLNEFNDDIQESASSYASDSTSEVSC